MKSAKGKTSKEKSDELLLPRISVCIPGAKSTFPKVAEKRAGGLTDFEEKKTEKSATFQGRSPERERIVGPGDGKEKKDEDPFPSYVSHFRKKEENFPFASEGYGPI